MIRALAASCLATPPIWHLLRRRALRRGEKTYAKGDYPRPKVDYEKISDQVEDPPAGWKQPRG